MSDIRVVCPCCGVSLRAKAQLAGQTIRCPKCVSLVPIKGSEDEDFAQPVEASYDAVPLEEDNVGRLCPKCSNSLRPSAKLCQQCGWHLELETYFEDLKAENLIVREEPKTKWEAWFESQLHESTRPRDVLNYSAIGGVVLTIIFLAVAHFRLGAWALLTLPLLVVVWIGWYRIMQLIGLLHDPTRKRQLAKAQVQRETASAPVAAVAATAPVKTRAAVQSGAPVKSNSANSTGPLDFDLPDAEIPSESKSKPKSKSTTPAAAPQRKVVRPGQANETSNQSTTSNVKSAPAQRPAKSEPKPQKERKPASPAPPAAKPVAEKPQKPKAADDDWLSDLL
ncbi:hypothetical protein M4951_08700 [Blastopirellula sp. J2-11]|uniref:zinc ribbon domain-containing protein n=1 Tax=Blastopirellula sp. J2-11 TaxID=2943192 RepID=UPI0021C5C438|nr:zinc ribbon domain-containing protein [Blastopirellula sp. J2-11]UUO08380.1 hypothetical protein M4951_08700 [Blastopirellula sp. J2-11]